MTRPTLVTGAGGFVGSHVCDLLLRRREPFVGVLSPHSSGPAAWRSWPPDAFVRVDLRDGPAVARLLREHEPIRIVNLAASGVAQRPDEPMLPFVDINVRLPALLFEEMAPDCTLVHVGSMYELAAPREHIGEDDPKGEHTTLYGCTKAAGDAFLRIASTIHGASRRCVRARLFLACGAGEKPHRLIPSIVAAWRAGRPLPLSDGEQVRDLIHASDAALGLLHVAAVPELAGRSVNVARGTGSSIRYVAERAADRLGCRELLRFGELPRRAGEPQRTVADVARAAATGWAPRLDLDATIDRAVDELASGNTPPPPHP